MLSTDSPVHFSYQVGERDRWLSQLAELIAFPTISALPQHRRDIRLCAQWLARHLAEIGLQNVQVLPGANGGHPSAYADWLHAPGKPTLLFYGHYDVQPVDPLNEWRKPPFKATIVGENLFGRGASDDKGQLFIHLKAIESYLKTIGSLPINVKVWLEGEEEIGSPNLSAFLNREAKRLQADAVLVSDTEMLELNRPSIIYGLRGNLNCELELSGPRHDLHSGRYGGAVHNPLQALSEMIGGLHDRKGRVAIPGFYRRVRELKPAQLQESRCACARHQQILQDLDIPAGWGEEGYSLFERMTSRPALTINGLAGGYTGPGTKAVIPRKGLAHFSFRLVPDQEPKEIAQFLRSHIAAITPPAVRSTLKITGGSRPVLLPARSAVMQAAVRAVQQTWGVPPVFTRSGGTIPLVEQLHRSLGIPIVLLGFGLADDDIHAPNEKMHLPTFFRGIETVIRLIAEYGK
jgi:acetylornithine deacetylase/succinyl-diaminopimelate desuccinylase-like protein